MLPRIVERDTLLAAIPHTTFNCIGSSRHRAAIKSRDAFPTKHNLGLHCIIDTVYHDPSLTMTSVLVVQPRDIKASLSATQPFPIMSQTRRPTPPSQVKVEEDPERPHGPPSQAEDYDIDDMDSDGDGDNRNGNSSNSESPVKKRRRSRKGLDKKFECPTEGCGKSYSRAEHL